jgi:hypothetical protein
MFWLAWQLAGVVLAVVILAVVLGLGLLAIGVVVEVIDVLRRVEGMQGFGRFLLGLAVSIVAVFILLWLLLR